MEYKIDERKSIGQLCPHCGKRFVVPKRALEYSAERYPEEGLEIAVRLAWEHNLQEFNKRYGTAPISERNGRA